MTAENQSPRTARSTTPYLLEILRSDPFARYLKQIHLTPVSFAVVVFIYNLFRNLILPAIFGHLFTVEQGGRTILGVLDDWPVLVNELVMVPVVAGYYLWQPSTMQTLYDGISERIGPSPLARPRRWNTSDPSAGPAGRWWRSSSGYLKLFTLCIFF